MRTFLLFAALVWALSSSAVYRYVGGDISLLPDYEKAGANYLDKNGSPVELLPFLHQEGMNAMRVRLFVDPSAYTGPDKDPNACQTLEYILPLCKDIKSNGFDLMLDFHYSDTWADPAKQWTPAAWQGLNDSQLVEKIYSYTKETLEALKEAGAAPDFIQPGNEISYGMLWGSPSDPESSLKKTFMGSEANWQRLADLLNSAAKACREVCPDAKLIIHTERVAQPDVQKNFYSQMRKYAVDYDLIGLSYYPYFHGTIPVLGEALKSLEANFPEKNIMIVETGFPYAWEVPGSNQDVEFDYSLEGQNEFALEIVDLLRSFKNVNGLFWWWMEYNAYGTSLSGWYNAPLFDSRTGKATPALSTICSFSEGNDSAVGEIGCEEPSYTPLYDLQGRKIANPSKGTLYIKDKKLTLER